MGNDLPYDVWLRVAKFLEPSALGKLISVNRAFFDAVIEMRYRDVDTDFLSRTIGRLRWDPYIASRVRTLRLDHQWFPDWKMHPPLLYKIITYIQCAAARRNIISPRKVSFRGDPDYLGDMPDCIFGIMTNLTSLKLESSERHPSPAEFAIVPTAWSILGSRLQTLSLKLSPWSFERLLPSTIIFPNLETLVIKFYTNYISSIFTPYTIIPNGRAELIAAYGPIVSTSLLPFINRHKHTLTSFSFSHTAAPLLDSSLIPLGMGYFPCLKKLSFEGIEDPEGIQHIWKLLALHAEGLEEIFIERSVVEPLPLYKGPVLARHPSFGAKFTGPIPDLGFLASIASHLTSLKLSGQRFHYPEVCDVINILEDHTRIDDLTMKLDFLSPQVIDLFAERMSHLRHLCLHVKTCAVIGDPSVGTETQGKVFRAALAKRQYPEWKLQTFEILYLLKISDKSYAALSRIFPQIQARLDPLWHQEDRD